MLPLALIPMQYKLIGAAVLAVVLLGGAYFKGRESGLEKFYEFRSQVEAANAQAEAENARRLAEAKADTQNVADAHALAMGHLARDYNSRLAGMRSRCSGQTMRPPTTSTAGLNAGTAHSGLNTGTVPPTEDYDAIVKKLETDAVKTTAQLIYLQEYVTRVCLGGR